MMALRQAEPEFSRLVHIDELDKAEKTYELTAEADEREAIARRFGLVALDRLTATARLTRRGSTVRARVNLVADVVQSCVVTLDPVPAHIKESFERVFVPEAEVPAGIEVVLGEDDDLFEPLREGGMDLGEAVAEQLALALNPYPRRPDVSVDAVLGECQTIADEDEDSSFRALKGLVEQRAAGKTGKSPGGGG